MDWGVPGGGGGNFCPRISTRNRFLKGKISSFKVSIDRFQLFGGLAKIMSLFFEYDSSYLGDQELYKQQKHC